MMLYYTSFTMIYSNAFGDYNQELADYGVKVCPRPEYMTASCNECKKYLLEKMRKSFIEKGSWYQPSGCSCNELWDQVQWNTLDDGLGASAYAPVCNTFDDSDWRLADYGAVACPSTKYRPVNCTECKGYSEEQTENSLDFFGYVMNPT